MGNSASSLPYSIGKQVQTVNNGWTLHEGSQKSDGAAVTVFCAKKPAVNKTCLNQSRLTQMAPVLHHFVHCKKLRHPQVLNVHATLDTDHPEASAGAAHPPAGGGSTTKEMGDYIIVTEPCITLEAWLQTQPSNDQLAWGLESMVRALHFLHASANLVHGNLSPESWYVTPAGDVKLWNFSLVSAFTPESGVPLFFKDYEGLVTPTPYRSPERQEGRWDAISNVGVHAMDSYGLGVLIGHLYGGRPPQQLQKALQRLLTTNLKMRPRLQPLLKCPVFNTPYQKLQLQLEELSVQPVEQKVAFWQNLMAGLQSRSIPESLAVHKLLPIMKSSIITICQSESMRTQALYRREVLSTLQPLFFVAEHYLDDTFATELSDTIRLLFAVNDRGIRGVLLQKTPLFVNNLDKNSLNHAVFEPMCSGFSDSSAALRELTLKATLALVPNLTQPNLEKLSRYLVRLQGDPEASIRTNTVIFFAKLAPHLTEMTRQKQLLPAFTRAMKDPFTPCRLAALQCVLKSKEFFDAQAVAGKLLPVVTPNLLDAAMEVRKQAFAVVDDLLFYLRQESERMPVEPATIAPGSGHAAKPTGATKTAAAPSSGGSSGYLSGISSWMSTPSSPKQTPAAAAPATAPPPRSAPPIPNVAGLSVSHHESSSNNLDLSDGWGDDDLDLSNGGVKANGGSSLFAPTNNDEDDFFASSFDAKPARPVAAAAPRSAGARLAVPAKKTKPVVGVTKLAANDDMDDGWDDF